MGIPCGSLPAGYGVFGSSLREFARRVGRFWGYPAGEGVRSGHRQAQRAERAQKGPYREGNALDKGW